MNNVYLLTVRRQGTAVIKVEAQNKEEALELYKWGNYDVADETWEDYTDLDEPEVEMAGPIKHE